MNANDELLILHLSDLHFGNKNRYLGLTDEAAKELGKKFWRAVDGARLSLKIERKVDLVIVSGDIAESGKASEFQQAEHFLKALAGEIGLNPTKFVFVPGNHDISWTKCKSVDIEIEEESLNASQRRAEIDARKLAFYDRFLENFYPRPIKELPGRSIEKGGRVHDFDDLNLSVAALNSCERESHDKGDHIGSVSASQTQSLLNVWTEQAYRPRLKLIVVHHNPIVTTASNIATWREWLLKDPRRLQRISSHATKPT